MCKVHTYDIGFDVKFDRFTREVTPYTFTTFRSGNQPLHTYGLPESGTSVHLVFVHTWYQVPWWRVENGRPTSDVYTYFRTCYLQLPTKATFSDSLEISSFESYTLFSVSLGTHSCN